jgi:hypothetical protein
MLNTLWYVRSIIFFRKLLFSWIDLMILVFIFRRHITAGWWRDTRMFLSPTQISFRICGWRQDRRLVDPIEIGCADSPTLRSRTCGQPVVSQSLGARNRYRAPSLKSSWPCNNIRPISLKNMSDFWQIINNSAKWSWTWNHRWVVRVRSLFSRMVPGTTNLLLFQCRHFSNLILFEHIHL